MDALRNMPAVVAVADVFHPLVISLDASLDGGIVMLPFERAVTEEIHLHQNRNRSW